MLTAMPTQPTVSSRIPAALPPFHRITVDGPNR